MQHYVNALHLAHKLVAITYITKEYFDVVPIPIFLTDEKCFAFVVIDADYAFGACVCNMTQEFVADSTANPRDKN